MLGRGLRRKTDNEETHLYLQASHLAPVLQNLWKQQKQNDKNKFSYKKSLWTYSINWFILIIIVNWKPQSERALQERENGGGVTRTFVDIVLN